MKKSLFLVAAVSAGMMTSCGISAHLTANRNVVQTNVNLSEKNYRVVGDIQGSAKATYVLGIGGLSQKAIEANATADMLKNAKLNGSQAIINTSTEVKNRGVAPFYWKRVITTHSQIIEFTE